MDFGQRRAYKWRLKGSLGGEKVDLVLEGIVSALRIQVLVRRGCEICCLPSRFVVITGTKLATYSPKDIREGPPCIVVLS